MVNPIADVFNWFIMFQTIIPGPVIAFLWLALTIYFLGCFLRWFL